MFNAFQSRSRSEIERRKSKESTRRQHWQRKHDGSPTDKIEQRDELAKKYNARVENFVLRICQEPIEVRNLDELTVHYQKPLKQVSIRRPNKQMFCAYSRADQSILTSSRVQTASLRFRTNPMKTVRKPIIKLDSQQSRQLYVAHNTSQYDYRPRQKDKEIQNAPMRHNFIPRLLNEQTGRERKQSQSNDIMAQTSSGFTDKDASVRKSNSNDEEVMSILSKLIRPIIKKQSTPKKTRSRTTTIQFPDDDEDQQQQGWQQANMRKTHQQKQPAHSRERLHFKGAMQLASNKTPISRFAREGLQRCRIARFAALAEQKQKDHLLFFDQQ